MYKKVPALIIFKRRVPACQTPVRVNPGSCLVVPRFSSTPYLFQDTIEILKMCSTDIIELSKDVNKEEWLVKA